VPTHPCKPCQPTHATTQPHQALRFAAANKALAPQLAPAARDHAHDWARQWQLSDKEAFELYLTSAQLLKVGGSHGAAVAWGGALHGGRMGRAGEGGDSRLQRKRACFVVDWFTFQSVSLLLIVHWLLSSCDLRL